MYDTFGFPMDLTLLMCEEKGFSVDSAAFEAEMEAAKKKARAGGHFGDKQAIVLEAEQTDALKNKMGVAPTDDEAKYAWDSAAGSGATFGTTLKSIINGKKAWLESVDGSSDLVGLVLESTPFYAEAGGQVCDIGTISAEGGFSFGVEDVQKFGAYVLHIGRCTAGNLAPGAAVSCVIDYARRALIAKNHTCTHMFNLALRNALGVECEQRGSLCDQDKLRFDFAHNKPLSVEELAKAQQGVNAQIEAALAVHTQVAALDKAQAVQGLRAVFGEQYPDPVRVVSVGGPGVQQMLDAPADGTWKQFSIEFCGGTHIASTSEAGTFVLLSEEGLGRGVRRMVGLTHKKAEEALATANELATRVAAAQTLKGRPLVDEAAELSRVLETAVVPATDMKALRDAVNALKKMVVEASKGNAKANTEAAKAEAADMAAAAKASGAKFVVGLLTVEADAKVVEAAHAALASQLPEAAVMVLGAGMTACALATVPAAIQDKIDAKDWVNTALKACGGKGGGKLARAQGAARDPANIAKAKEDAQVFGAERLS